MKLYYAHNAIHNSTSSSKIHTQTNTIIYSIATHTHILYYTLAYCKNAFILMLKHVHPHLTQ